MGLILWIIIGIFLIFFIATTLWIVFVFIKHSKRDYNLYKSVAKSVFSRKLSLIIIVIFYMISFGLVGGLTSAIGRLNAEATDYIKENHLHQGVTREANFSNKDFSQHTMDQKTFYLATQGVIDFYNGKLLKPEEDNPTGTYFIDMLGGQDTTPRDGIPVTPEQRFNGATSPLSYKSNREFETGEGSDHFIEETTPVLNNYFSIHDIGQFWNTWYEDNFVTSDTGELYEDSDHWKTYYYNGKERTYDISKCHNTSPIVAIVENRLNEIIFYDGDDATNWTFAASIANEFNGLDTFSEVVFAFFDNDIDKYLAAIGTLFLESGFDLYLDEENSFASSDVYEYQKTFYGTDFLLQSYNKNQLTNEKSLINNPGYDETGAYAIDTVTFYDNNGKETNGPDQNDDFFKPHEGSKDDPYQIYVTTEYYEDRGLSDSVGDARKLFTYDGPNNNGLYYEIKGSYRSPTYSFPMQTLSDSLQKPEDNAAILINTQSLLRLTRKQDISTTNYEFFGFSSVYDSTKQASDWYFHSDYDGPTDGIYFEDDLKLYSWRLNSFYGDSSWGRYRNINDDDTSAPQTFYIDIDEVDSGNTIISYRSFTIIREIYTDKIIYSVIMGIFLVITMVVLILLIRKRIQDSNKQLGTIKALGYSPGRIASAYTIFPIIIILIGGIMAIVVALPLSLWFTSLYGGFFSLNLMVPYVGAILWIKIFIIPLLISMFLGYWIAYWTIKKPTLDLLNNVGKDKPNWLVRGTSHLIPAFASFGFTYKTKGVGRAFFKSLLLFVAILGSMSITSFAFASSTMSATMTKQVFDIIDYNGKTWEYGAPFIDDVNLNDEDWEENGKYEVTEAFDLFPDASTMSSTDLSLKETRLGTYVAEVLLNPEEALASFQKLYESQYPAGFDFHFEIDYAPDGSMVPAVTSDYYITWKSAVALWTTDIALHVPAEDGAGNNALNEPIILCAGDDAITFNMLDPILRNYAVNLSANIVTRYGKEATFQVINFAYKVLDSYQEKTYDPKEDLAKIKNWLLAHSIENIGEKVAEAINNEYIFNDIVFNKNYYDGEDDSGAANQTMTTAGSGYFLKTDAKGELIFNGNGKTYHRTDTYMEGYASTNELMKTNNVGDDALDHIAEVENDPNKLDDLTVNVAMTQSGFKELKHYKEATPQINAGLGKDEARVLVKSKVWDTTNNMYTMVYVPIIFDVEIYDSIYPLGTFFLQDDLEGAINCSLAYIQGLDGEFTNLDNEEVYPWYGAYSNFIENEWETIGSSVYETNYSVTYNIDTTGDDFQTAPFSVSLSEKGLIDLIAADDVNNQDIPLKTLVNNFYIPFLVPLSINIIITQGSRVYELLQGILYTIAFFALFIGITVVMIAMKDITDSNKREVSMFKAFGYSNGRATSLVMTPYLFVIVFAFIIAIPVSLIFLSTVGTILTLSTGTTYVFTLVLWQWIVVVGFIICLVIFLGFVGYKSYEHTNALEAISQTDE